MTHLYIKTHNETGLKYFGKTTQDPYSYRGSGLYWTRHIKKYGNKVSTSILGTFEDKSNILVETALKFSEDNNIVESNLWANIKPENGLDGGSNRLSRTKEKEALIFFMKIDRKIAKDYKKGLEKHRNISMFFKKANIMAIKVLGANYNLVQTISEEHKQKIRDSWDNRSIEEKSIINEKRSETLKGRVKGEQERLNISKALKGKKKSDEHVENNRLSNLGRITAFDVFKNITVTTNEVDFLYNKHYIGIKAKKFFICDGMLMRGKDLELYAKSKGFMGTNFSYKTNNFRLKFISSIEEINKEQYIKSLR